MIRNNQLGIYFRSIVLSLSLLVLGPAKAAVDPSAFYRNYWHPIFHGERLNYCALDGKTCGLALATRYCRLMGYQKADQAIIANNVGETRFMEARATCKGWQCNGFKTIRCVSKLAHVPPHSYYYRLHRYVYPRFNHYRIDWCYDGQKNCGRKPAFSFCRRMGYTKVKDFHQAKAIGATQAIGNQKLCFGNTCNGFAYIDCSR